MKADAAAANAAWYAASLPEWLRYRRAAANVEATQRALLRGYLGRNADTEFGRAHGFAEIEDWESYTERVPIRTYDEFRPWIERIAKGDSGVLTADTVELLEPSSGSSGAEKWVPYTETLRAEFRRAVAVWIAQLFAESPGLMGGRAYWSLTPQRARQRRQHTQVPVGFDDDSAYLGGIAQRIIERTLVTSSALQKIADMDTFWRATLLLLLGCRDLRLISVWHPSYAGLLLEHLRAGWSALLEDLHTGFTLETPPLRIEPDADRARELTDIGPDDPAAIWPDLGLVSAWGDAHAAGGFAELRRAFAGVRLQAKGLVATEAFVTLALGELKPLAVRSHVFEFLGEDGGVRPAWALERGAGYSVIVTTGGGLYRYRLQDRVEVDGVHDGIPSLRFLGKEDNVSDYFGEKLSEAFVAAALDAVFERRGLEPAFAMLAMDESAAAPGYALYVECDAPIVADLAAELEAELCRNPHYALCQRLGQLRPARVVPVSKRAYEIYARAMTARGMRLGDIKPTPLSRFSDWARYF